MGFLDNKTAVVLGASKSGGMGDAISQSLIKEGAKVIIAARGEKKVKALAAELGP
ncbi:MAG: SDR family NAD(P)-dependent oxidoreductase [Proteobacteria bacterium]|nr:SDR family NAD(P)-dependent oxidoreductase [Pseudomonadota bacterium]